MGSGPGGEEAADILDHHQAGVEGGDGVDDVAPQAGAGAGGQSGAGAGDGQVLAGESGGQDTHGVRLVPVDALDVSVVGDAGPVAGEDPDGVRVALRVPDGVSSEGGPDAEVEAADSGEQAADREVSGRHSGP
ncbi:hypothetical protein OK074_4621 [Actinobacteria bacterium OK074]|nr:hypothetical protein OK074_4621 [Actinobacteria bacterium OK074]